MTFPVIQSSAESASGAASATTSHVFTMPSGIVVGNLLLIIADKGSVSLTMNALSGWNELLDENQGNGIFLAWRIADGTEGANQTFTSSASGRTAGICYRISGAQLPTVQAPELSTVATGTSTSPNATTCTPTGGAKDYLYITFFGSAGEEADDDTWVTGTPTNYGSLVQKTCGTAGTNLGGLFGCAVRNLNAASDDAGAFTIAVSAAWRAYTVAVHPLPEPIIATMATMRPA